MGKRKYFSEAEDVQYMMKKFIVAMDSFFENQKKQGSALNQTMLIDVVKDLFLLADMNYEKVSLTTKYKLAQKIKQKLPDTSLVKTNTFYYKCINVVLALVDYYYVDTCKSTQYYKLLSAYNKWEFAMDFVRIKQDIQNIKLLISKVFTR